MVDSSLIEADSQLPNETQAARDICFPAAIPEHVLLSGGTGFLGGYLLYSLLRQSSTIVHCMVRAENPEQGARRLQDTLVTRGLWDEAFQRRIVPVLADLGKPLFGLSPSAFARLANRVDAIYHSGAQVSFGYPYKMLRRVNVLGVQEMLRLAAAGRGRLLHYVSTIGVFAPLYSLANTVLAEDTPLPPLDAVHPLGYTYSKHIAEHLVATAQIRGLAVRIYRPGLISGHSMSGLSSVGDFISHLLRACILLQAFPDVSPDISCVL